MITIWPLAGTKAVAAWHGRMISQSMSNKKPAERMPRRDLFGA